MENNFLSLQNKLNQRVVKEIREDERKKVLEDVRKMINKISDLNFSIQIKKRLIEELNKLENEK